MSPRDRAVRRAVSLALASLVLVGIWLAVGAEPTSSAPGDPVPTITPTATPPPTPGRVAQGLTPPPTPTPPPSGPPPEPTQPPTATATATPATTEPLPTRTVVGPSGGTVNAGGLQVTVPPGAVAFDVQFEVQRLPTPPPNGNLIAIGAFALTAGGGSIFQFDKPLTILFRYAAADVAGLDESSLWIYIVRNGALEPLSSCVPYVDQISRGVSCQTTHFTDFEIAGTLLPTPTPRGGSRGRTYLPLGIREAIP